MERGTVSMRVAFVLRSAEVQPLVPAICDVELCVCVFDMCMHTASIMTHPPPSLPKQQQLGRIDYYNPILLTTIHKAPHATTHTYTCTNVVVGSSADSMQHCQQPDITQQCV